MPDFGSIAKGVVSDIASAISGDAGAGTTLTKLGAPEEAKANNRLANPDNALLKDPFWDYAAIKNDRWNKSYPYRLALYKKGSSEGEPKWSRNPTIPPFTLPIPPESLTIDTPFAISTVVTLGGIVEEHNGAPLRTISISGTTGILPLRGSVNGSSLSKQTSILAGTVNAIGGLARDVKTLGQAPGGKTENPNVVSEADLTAGADRGTGYYQFKLLERWFESYAAFKKTRDGRDFIMALEIWKDDAVFLVTPVTFQVRRSIQAPLEYTYSMQFKAWKRIRLVPDGSSTFRHDPVARDPNKLFQVLNKLQEARQVLQGAKNVLKAVRADINQVLFTPLRESILFCKDALGVAVLATDLPSSLIRDLKEPLLEAVSLGGTFRAAGTAIQAAPRKIEDAFKSLSIQASKAEISSGQRAGSVGGGQASNQQGLNGASPANKISDNPDDNFEFFDGIEPGDLNLRPATQRKIDEEKRRVRLLKREDFEKARNDMEATLADFEAAVGAGNATYTRIYGTPARTSTRTPTDSDFEVIFALNQAITEMNRLAASSTINQDEISSIDYFAGLASRSGIAFTTPRSKFLVPFLYGHTLEQLAALYLGTPDRWHEIAALNGLQAPYVDETGFSLPLLVNGNGNTVTVADASNLYSGQQVWIGSVTVGRTKRRISRIEALSPTVHLVYLTGDPDLSQYTVASSATLQAFLPNTVNSQMSLYMPSDEDVDEDDFRQKSIPGIDYFDPLVRVGGIDLLLTPAGDLVITPDGDTRLAVGLTNIVQKVRLVLDTPRGTLLHHPEYGFPLQPGISTADMSAQDILNVSRDLFRGDPTFSGVESAAILKDGAVVKVSLSVGISGTSQVVPITVEIPR